MRGDSFLYPSAVTTLVRDYVERGGRGEEQFDVLTPRELEVLKLIAEAHTSKEIAEAALHQHQDRRASPPEHPRQARDARPRRTHALRDPPRPDPALGTAQGGSSGMEFVVAHYSEGGSGYGGYKPRPESLATNSPSEPQGGRDEALASTDARGRSSDKRQTSATARADAPRVPSVGCAKAPRAVLFARVRGLSRLDLGAGAGVRPTTTCSERRRSCRSHLRPRSPIDASGETSRVRGWNAQ